MTNFQQVPSHSNSSEDPHATNRSPAERHRRTKEPQALAGLRERRAPAQGEGRATPQPEDRKRHTDTPKNLTPEEALQKFALPREHPVSVVRDLSRALYAKLDEFVETNMNRPSAGFGFSAKNVPPLQVDGLAETCTLIIRSLTAVIKIPALDPVTVRAQDIAKDLKLSLLSFRHMLSQDGFKGGVPTFAVDEVLQTTMVFQRSMSDQMNDLTSMSYGVEIMRTPPADSEE